MSVPRTDHVRKVSNAVGDLPYSVEQITRAACIDSGAHVAFMELENGEFTLVLSADKKIVLRPKMENRYMEVLKELLWLEQA